MTSIRSSVERGIVPSLSDDERRAQRVALSLSKIAGLERSDPVARLRYFLNECCGQEEIWTAFAMDQAPGGWYDQESEADVVAVWPNVEFSQGFLEAKPEGWSVLPVPVDAWIDEIAPSLLEVDYKVAVLPVPKQPCLIIGVEDFCDELENHWKLFVKSVVLR